MSLLFAQQTTQCKAYLIPFHTTAAELHLFVLKNFLSSEVLMAPHI